LANIRTADVEDFIASLKKPRQDGRTLAPASINRTVTLLRHMFSWAIGREYLDRTPFRRGTEKLIRLEQEDNKRRRRVSADEEAKLLAAAPPQLRSMIVAALDTGMRRGEMLALRFADIDLDRGLIVLRGVTTKSGKTRQVPISTRRLRAVFEWLRIDGEGKEKPAGALVFGGEEGEPVATFRRAWVTTVLKAHGVKTTWVKTPAQEGRKAAAWKQLAPECNEAFKRINLHWHDLRHEYASRLVERGVPLAQVRDLLGHASITTTERYDNQTMEALQAAAKRLEEGKTFDANLPREAGTDFQDSFKIAAGEPRSDEPQAEEETGVSAGKSEDLQDLAGRQGFEPR
jgi:integrase